jgi:hypothetical protein
MYILNLNVDIGELMRINYMIDPITIIIVVRLFTIISSLLNSSFNKYSI